MKNPPKRFQENKKAISWLFGGSAVLLALGFVCIFKCMELIEGRQGMVLGDFLHPYLPGPLNLSTWIFTATYSATIFSIFYVLKKGMYFSSIIFLAYSVMLVVRSICVVAIPLNPPPEMIPLEDTFIKFFNPANYVYSKDLFFSGHTASMFFYYLLVKDKRIKNAMLFLAIFVVIAISIQRIHYTIDIIGGVVAAYAGFSLVRIFDKKLWHLCYRPIVQKLPVLKTFPNTNQKEKLANMRP